MTDFDVATAHIRRGFCPLCGVFMRTRELSSDGLERYRCGMRKVGWHLTAIDGRVMLTVDRRLEPHEIRFLYARR